YHLSILKTLLERYKNILNSNGFVDNITVVDDYEINKEYLGRFDEIVINFEGYMTNFEKKIYLEIASCVNLKLNITLTPYDKKLIDSFENISLPLNSEVSIDLTNRKIISAVEKKKPDAIDLVTVFNRIEQIGVIKNKIEKFVNEGIDPEKIAVIIPDESFGSSLMLFDSEGNFNFAKGLPFTSAKSFRALRAIEKFKNEENKENSDRLKSLTVEEVDYNQLMAVWENVINIDETISILEKYNGLNCTSKEKEIYTEELYKLKKILEKVKIANVKEVIHLFLSRLKGKSLDHKGGGKVTVLGLLETRESYYDGIIIIDFNDKYVPQDSVKDMFINSGIKKRALLPSTEDRENYQKSLYYKILEKAKRSAIVYVESDENTPSRFLKSMKIDFEVEESRSYDSLLFTIHNKKNHFEKEIIEKIDLAKEPLSNSKFKAYLDCKRKFYYRYIKSLKPHEEDSKKPFQVGLVIHKALNEIYTRKNAYGDFKELERDIESFLDKESKKDITLKYQLGIWKEKLKPFIANEIRRFEDGYKILYLEKEFKRNYDGIILNGKIDRVDLFGESVSILDYKTGKINKPTLKTLEKTTDFQLVFYQLLLEKNHMVDSMGLYDLNSGKIHFEDLYNEKLELFKEYLQGYKDTEQNFSLTEDQTKCIYCDYKLICNR
ncbi:MAG: PD-(D/E)XK nuclease family protein, partial [Campylobacterales bacterium]|nr:PD-(D/E)XK nuclease family protein [Campylobacterales bacterium]